MERPGHQVLSADGLAGNEHRRVRRRHSLELLDRVADRRGAAHDAVDGLRSVGVTERGVGPRRLFAGVTVCRIVAGAHEFSRASDPSVISKLHVMIAPPNEGRYDTDSPN